jgi:hypothetical protein
MNVEEILNFFQNESEKIFFDQNIVFFPSKKELLMMQTVRNHQEIVFIRFYEFEDLLERRIQALEQQKTKFLMQYEKEKQLLLEQKFKLEKIKETYKL